MNNYEVSGFYGTRNAATIFVSERRNYTWYCVEGSTNINKTTEEIKDGINIESVHDIDYLSADNPVNSIEDLLQEVDG